MTTSDRSSSAVSAESFFEIPGILPSFPSLIPLLELASMLAGDGLAFAIPVNRTTRHFETSLVQSASPASTQVANLVRCLELHPAVLKTLSRGEHAVIHVTGDVFQVRWKCAQLPMPDPCLLLMPILGEQSLMGLICTEFRGVSLTSEAAETIRLLSARAAVLIEGGDANPDPSSAPSTYRDALAEIRLRIVSNVTHELRAPLTAIRGYTKIVLEERAGPLNPTQREYLGIVLEKAEKLANVMTWSGSLLQRSEEDLVLTSCDLLALWAECVRKNTGSLAAKNLKLQEKLPPGRLSIACDRRKMALALEAFLKYAGRSVDHGGSIEIELREGSEKVLFKICHAAGPAGRELLKSVLERREPPNSTPFEDADLSALANARDIINLHGGTASIFNDDGTGLGVVFTLPNFVERGV